MVEHTLGKGEVVGSAPITGSTKWLSYGSHTGTKSITVFLIYRFYYLMQLLISIQEETKNV